MADASSVAATFARDGYACVGVPGLEEASAAFASDFLDCAYEWFAAQLPAEHLAALPPWRSYGDLGNVLDPGWRKAHLSPGAAASARRALDGGGNAQFHPYKGWRLSGFGICSHLRGLDFPLRALRAVRRAAEAAVGGERLLPIALPTLILKPPSAGGKLGGHVDGGSLRTLYGLAVRCGGGGMDAWVREHGCQTLFHALGARDAAKPCGATRGLQFLTPRRYAVLLSMFHPDCLHPAVPAAPPPRQLKAAKKKTRAADDGDALPVPVGDYEFREGADPGAIDRWTRDGGPVFAPFFDTKVLAALNDALVLLEGCRGGLPDVRRAIASDAATTAAAKWLRAADARGLLAPLVCAASSPAEAETRPPVRDAPMVDHGPYVVSWPKGTPHRVDATGRAAPRVSLAAYLAPAKAADRAEVTRAFDRLDAIARAAHGGPPALDGRLARPFHQGIVHTHTETELAILPHFRRLYAAPERLAAARAQVDAWFAEADNDGPPAKRLRLVTPQKRPLLPEGRGDC